MNYKLAKKLKDAGFPQKGDGDTIHTDVCGGWDAPDPECTRKSRPYVPTLEELIEACGDKNSEGFCSLTLELDLHDEGDKINAQRSWIAKDWEGNEYGGKTHFEAVSYLWLALKKKS